jgi:hypothetical protein
MALISYGIQLTSTPVNSGPKYAVSYSTNCTTYTYAGVITLQDTASIGYADIEETSTCIKLSSIGNCTNEVVSGSSPSTSSYNTHLITLTQKNGSGPEFIVSETSSSLFTYLDTIELASQGATATIEPSTSSVAIRLRSNGVCQTNVVKYIGTEPIPTPTPTAAPPTPTPSGQTPTPVPPTPTPTFPGVSVNIYRAKNTGTVAGSSVTFNAALDGTEYTFYDLVNDDVYFTSRTTPTSFGAGVTVTDLGVATEPFSSWNTGSWDMTRTQDMEFRTGNDRAIMEFYNAATCQFETGSIFSNLTSLNVRVVSGSNTENGVPTINRGTIYTDGTCSIAPTPTPTPGPVTPTPTPAPTPSTCYTFYTIYKSTVSATDACCNQFSTNPVYLDASSLATATAVYSVPNCSTLEPNPGYYTQNLYEYYYWTGASLVGPTSCPGCP